MNFNSLFVQSFKTGENNPTRNYFVTYYIATITNKRFHLLINDKQVFDQSLKIHKKHMKNL